MHSHTAIILGLIALACATGAVVLVGIVASRLLFPYPRLERHHGHDVWVNQQMDFLRRTQCLCLNCENLKPGRTTATSPNRIMRPA